MPTQYTPSDIQRFNSKIKITSSGCHEWQGFLEKRGYGKFRIGEKMMRAHRVAWEMANGPIPPKMYVLHRCDNPRCCNPEHLWIGTQTDNMHDCAAKGRMNKARGERSGNAKLTEKDVMEIREVYAGGNRTQMQLASAFQVDQGLISAIVRRAIWRHI